MSKSKEKSKYLGIKDSMTASQALNKTKKSAFDHGLFFPDYSSKMRVVGDTLFIESQFFVSLT